MFYLPLAMNVDSQKKVCAKITDKVDFYTRHEEIRNQMATSGYEKVK